MTSYTVFFSLSLLLGFRYHFNTLFSNVLILGWKNTFSERKTIAPAVESGIYVQIENFLGSILVEYLG